MTDQAFKKTEEVFLNFETNLSPDGEPPKTGKGIRVAFYQGEGKIGTAEAVEYNMNRLEFVAEKAKWYRSHIVVFPEKYNTGYAITVKMRDEFAETKDGKSIVRAQKVAKKLEIAIILPYPERDNSRGEEKFYDSIAFIGPDGKLLANYRKTHLYGKAERRNYSFGDEWPPVFKINGFPVGILNCYEMENPLLYAYLVLKKDAKLIIGPTAADHHFPLATKPPTPTLVPYPDAARYALPAMAHMLRIFTAYANRRGVEYVPDVGWWRYAGNTSVFAPNADVILKAGTQQQFMDTLFVVDCNPDQHKPFSPEGNFLDDNRVQLADEMLPGK